NFLNSNTIVFIIFYVLMKFFVNTIEFISMSMIVVKLNIGSTMAVDAPSHTQVSKLLYFRHFLDFAMTCLASHLAYIHVLRVIKINVVGEIMNLNPFNWFAGSIIFFLIRIPSCIFI